MVVVIMLIVEKSHLLFAFICLYISYLKDFNMFDLFWDFCVWEAFHIHSLILIPWPTPWDRQGNDSYSCCTFPISKIGFMENWSNSMCHSPRRGRVQLAQHMGQNLPPLCFNLPLGLGYFCLFCVTAGFSGNWNFNIPPFLLLSE